MTELRYLLQDALLLLEEALFAVFGDVIYDIGVKRLVLLLLILMATPIAVIICRKLYRSFNSRSQKIDQILGLAEENSKLLRRLTAERNIVSDDGESGRER